MILADPPRQLGLRRRVRAGDGKPLLRVANFAGTMRPGHDGVTRVLYRMIEAMQGSPIETLFVSPIVPPELERAAPMHGVPSVAFPLYDDYRFAIPGERHFQDRLDAFGPDLLHIHSPCSLGFAATQYARRRGLAVVATYHTHFPSYAKYYGISALEGLAWGYLRRLYGRCRMVYVPSRPLVDELARHGIRNTMLLPHGVDTERFHPRFRSGAWRSALGLDGRTVFLFVGRLVWEKDLRTMIGAYRRIMADRSDCAFVFVGDGPVRRDLERAMPRARFLGYQAGDDLSTAFASSDVFVFPSTTETFGNVVVEAMASGLPAVCAGEGGPGGVVRHGETGFLTRPRDPEDLARHLALLAESPELREAMAATALASARDYSWPAAAEALCASYRQIASMAPPRGPAPGGSGR